MMFIWLVCLGTAVLALVMQGHDCHRERKALSNCESQTDDCVGYDFGDLALLATVQPHELE